MKSTVFDYLEGMEIPEPNVGWIISKGTQKAEVVRLHRGTVTYLITKKFGTDEPLLEAIYATSTSRFKEKLAAAMLNGAAVYMRV